MRKRKFQNFTFQATTDSSVRQWHFSIGKLFSAIGLGGVILGAFLFFSTEYLTQMIYEVKLNEIKDNYSSLSETLEILHTRVKVMNGQMENIEEKDKAIRSYANMPQIDNDIRSLGIGGVEMDRDAKNQNYFTDIESKLTTLELDIDNLTRNVKLELSSYKNIYDKVKQDTLRMRHIPSVRPVLGGYLNSSFGYRKDPLDGKRRYHYGQDITTPTGSTIYSPANGVVKDARYRGGFGKYIRIDHGYGYETIYAHLSRLDVKKGDRITRGKILGRSGNTGRSTAPHLHYEVHYYGTPQDPMDFFFSGYLK